MQERHSTAGAVKPDDRKPDGPDRTPGHPEDRDPRDRDGNGAPETPKDEPPPVPIVDPPTDAAPPEPLTVDPRRS